MKIKDFLKSATLCGVSYYIIHRLKLHFSIAPAFPNKSALFLLINLVLLLMLVVHKFSSTSVTNDDRLIEELGSYQSDAIVIPKDVPNDFLSNDELVEEKSIILVEKYAKEEQHREEEEEETMLDIFLSKDADTGWRRNLIQKPVRRLETVEEEDLDLKVKEIVCVHK
jgi:hypothetical protein